MEKIKSSENLALDDRKKENMRESNTGNGNIQHNSSVPHNARHHQRSLSYGGDSKNQNGNEKGKKGQNRKSHHQRNLSVDSRINDFLASDFTEMISKKNHRKVTKIGFQDNRQFIRHRRSQSMGGNFTDNGILNVQQNTSQHRRPTSARVPNRLSSIRDSPEPGTLPLEEQTLVRDTTTGNDEELAEPTKTSSVDTKPEVHDDHSDLSTPTSTTSPSEHEAFISAALNILKKSQQEGTMTKIDETFLLLSLEDNLTGSMVYCCHGEVFTKKLIMHEVLSSLPEGLMTAASSLVGKLKVMQQTGTRRIALLAGTGALKYWYVFKINDGDMKLACKLSMQCITLSIEEDVLFRSLLLFQRESIPISVIKHICRDIMQASRNCVAPTSLPDRLIATNLIQCENEHVVVTSLVAHVLYSDSMDFVFPATASCKALRNTLISDSDKKALIQVAIKRLTEFVSWGVDSLTEEFCTGCIQELSTLVGH